MTSTYTLISACVLLVATIVTNGFALVVGTSNFGTFCIGLLLSSVLAFIAMCVPSKQKIVTYGVGLGVITISEMWIFTVLRLNNF